MTSPKGGGGGPSTGGGSAGVSSFNTRTGAVTLSKTDVVNTGLAPADIGAEPAGIDIPLSTVTAIGDLIVGNGNASVTRLPTASTSGHALISTGTGSQLGWSGSVPLFQNSPGAKGSILAGASASSTSALTVGADGTALVADSTQTTGLKYTASAPALTGNNLSDLANAATARTNLGLGTAAVVNTGTTSGTVPVLNASGTVPVANVGTGSGSASQFLNGTGAFSTPPAPALTSAIVTQPSNVTVTTSTQTICASGSLASGVYIVGFSCYVQSTSASSAGTITLGVSVGSIFGAANQDIYLTQSSSATVVCRGSFLWAPGTSGVLTLQVLGTNVVGTTTVTGGSFYTVKVG